MHICDVMTKIISLSESAYSKLKSIKSGRSFSQVILGLMEKGKKERLSDVLDRIGKSDDLANAIEASYKKRNKMKLKEVIFE